MGVIGRRRYIKSVKRGLAAVRALRVTIRKRLQDRRSGKLYGAVRGASSKHRARLTAASTGVRYRKKLR